MANPINPNLLKLHIGRSPSSISLASDLPSLHNDLLIKKFVSGFFFSLSYLPSHVTLHRTPSHTYARVIVHPQTIPSVSHLLFSSSSSPFLNISSSSNPLNSSVYNIKNIHTFSPKKYT